MKNVRDNCKILSRAFVGFVSGELFTLSTNRCTVCNKHATQFDDFQYMETDDDGRCKICREGRWFSYAPLLATPPSSKLIRLDEEQARFHLNYAVKTLIGFDYDMVEQCFTCQRWMFDHETKRSENLCVVCSRAGAV